MHNFHLEVLQQQSLIVFGFLRGASHTIQLMHSPATYFMPGADAALKGKISAWSGTKQISNYSVPILLQPENPWKWVAKSVDANQVSLEAFYANPDNTTKLFLPSGTLALTKVPWMILLPLSLVAYCVEVPINTLCSISPSPVAPLRHRTMRYYSTGASSLPTRTRPLETVWLNILFRRSSLKVKSSTSGCACASILPRAYSFSGTCTTIDPATSGFHGIIVFCSTISWAVFPG